MKMELLCIMLYFSVDLDRFIHYCASLYVRVLEQLVWVGDDLAQSW